MHQNSGWAFWVLKFRRMNRYIVQPRTKDGVEQFVVLDTNYQPPHELGIFHDRATAIDQAAHYTQRPGMKVGAPIEMKKPKGPLDDDR